MGDLKVPLSTGHESLDSSQPDFFPSTEFAHSLVHLQLPASYALSAAAPAEELAFRTGSILDPETAHLVDSARTDAGIRVERVLATIARRAGVGGERYLRLSHDKRFAPNIATALVSSLDLPSQRAEAMLETLYEEFSEAARTNPIHWGWGSLSVKEGDLWVELSPTPAPVKSSRPRSKILTLKRTDRS